LWHVDYTLQGVKTRWQQTSISSYSFAGLSEGLCEDMDLRRPSRGTSDNPLNHFSIELEGPVLGGVMFHSPQQSPLSFLALDLPGLALQFC